MHYKCNFQGYDPYHQNAEFLLFNISNLIHRYRLHFSNAKGGSDASQT